ncbi:MAG: BrnT family toxin [Desulfonatronovibrio sp.]
MFEWDELKALANKAKHGISFADTFSVFEDPNALTVEDHHHNEQRHVTMGMDAFGRVLVVVYTWRGDRIRIISARKAVRHEVKNYEGQI